MKAVGPKAGKELVDWLERHGDEKYAESEMWSKFYATSLSVGNGGGLLAYFSAVTSSETSASWVGTRAGTAIGALLLLGLLSAGLVPWLVAIERRRLSRVSLLSADFVRAGEPKNWPGREGLQEALLARGRAGDWSNWSQALSALSFVAALSASLVLTAR